MFGHSKEVYPLLLLFGLSVAAGVWADFGGFADQAWLWLSLLLVSCCVAGILWRMVRRLLGEPFGGRARVGLLTIFVLTVCLGGFCYGEAGRLLWSVPTFCDEGEATVSGIVVSVRKADSTAVSFLVDADSVVVSDVGRVVHVGSCRCFVRAKTSALDGVSVVVGRKVLVVGRCEPLAPERFGRFDYSTYLSDNGVSAVVVAERVTAADGEVCSWRTPWRIVHVLAGMSQEALQSALRSCGVGERNIAFLRALLLGDRSLLSPEVSKAFRDCGTAHVLAVSGLHVGLIYVILVFLLRLVIPHEENMRRLILFAAIWLYACVTGLSASVVRSSLMISMVLGSEAFHREGHSMQPVFTAFVLQLVVSPLSALSLGLWLSYSAVLGLIAVARTVGRAAPSGVVKRWFFTSLAVSVVAQVSTTPITLFAFHSFPTYFWANNLVVVPLVTVVVCGALASLAFCWVPFVGSVLGGLTDWLLNVLTSYATFASHLPGATVEGIPFSRAEMFGYMFFVATLLLAVRRLNFRSVVVASLGLSVALLTSLASGVQTFVRRDALVYDCGRGEVGVSLCKGAEAVHFGTDTASADFIRIRDYLDARWGIKKSEVGSVAPGLRIESSDGRRIGFAVGDVPCIADSCDVVVIAADVLPEGEPDSVLYVVSPECAFAKIWEEAHRDVRIVPRYGKVSLSDCR